LKRAGGRARAHAIGTGHKGLLILRRFHLRRLWRVNCEALLTATGQNLKRLLSKRGWGRRSLPGGATLAVPQAITQLADLFVVVWVGLY
jgi:hypothetical protein